MAMTKTEQARRAALRTLKVLHEKELRDAKRDAKKATERVHKAAIALAFIETELNMRDANEED